MEYENGKITKSKIAEHWNEGYKINGTRQKYYTKRKTVPSRNKKRLSSSEQENR
jgi:hypothetical protein